MLRSGWNLPDGLMFIPEEKERVFDPDCHKCQGAGWISSDKGGADECNCWEDYDPGDCDPRHEYNYEDRGNG